jgi:hypothetical protein
MNTTNIQLTNINGRITVAYDYTPVVVELGIGIPLNHHWQWSFDGSLQLVESVEETGSDQLGDYSALALTYHGPDGPLVRQRIKVYEADSYLVVETTALRELTGTALEDSFFHTTFNSPVVRFATS